MTVTVKRYTKVSDPQLRHSQRKVPNSSERTAEHDEHGLQSSIPTQANPLIAHTACQ